MVDEKRKKGRSDDGEDEDDSNSTYTSEVISTMYDVPFYGHVSHNADDHKDLLRILRKAKTGDLVRLRLSSGGGSIQTGYLILNALKQTQAHVHCDIEAPCYSMASIIALACDSVKFHVGTFLMFHNYSGGIFGKGAEMKDHITHNAKINKDLDTYYCAPFLSKKEIERLSSDTDLYVHWDDKDLKERIKRHYKNQEKLK